MVIKNFHQLSYFNEVVLKILSFNLEIYFFFLPKSSHLYSCCACTELCAFRKSMWNFLLSIFNFMQICKEHSIPDILKFPSFLINVSYTKEKEINLKFKSINYKSKRMSKSHIYNSEILSKNVALFPVIVPYIQLHCGYDYIKVQIFYFVILKLAF